MPLRFTTIPGLKVNARRSVVFVADDDDESLNAKDVFDKLADKTRAELLSRFEHWIDGNVQDGYFHGWNDPERQWCFVFKYRKGGQQCRIYGFLCKPLQPGDVRFVACALAINAQKNAHETDPAIISRLEVLRKRSDVPKALAEIFPPVALSMEYINERDRSLTDDRRGKLDRRQR